MSQRLPITWGTEMTGVGQGAVSPLGAVAAGGWGFAPHGRGETLPMLPGDDGWFELETDLVEPGEGYGFVLADGVQVPDPAARAQLGGMQWPDPACRSRRL